MIRRYFAIPDGVRFFLRIAAWSGIAIAAWNLYRAVLLKNAILTFLPIRLSVFTAIRMVEGSFLAAAVILVHLYIAFRRRQRMAETAVNHEEAFSKLIDKITVLGMEIEIRERENADMFLELIAKRQMLNTVIDLIPMFVFAKDAEGKFFLVNRKVSDCYGVHQRDLIGKKDSDFCTNLSEAAGFRADDAEVISRKTVKDVEEMITCADGCIKNLITVKRPFMSWDGREGVLGISADVTGVYDAMQAIQKGHCNKCSHIQNILLGLLEIR